MTTLTKKIEVFENHTLEYDNWFNKHQNVFRSEVEAIRDMLPLGNSHGIEVGLGTGRFSVALGIKEGVEPSFSMRRMAVKRGIEVMDAVAEKLPYKDMHFDFVLMASCISYFYDMKRAFREAQRVLKKDGSFIIGFIEKNSIIGKYYEEKRQKNPFYKLATFYTTSRIISELEAAGFHNFEFSQTLFNELDKITEFQAAKPGYSEGSFVVVKAYKK